MTSLLSSLGWDEALGSAYPQLLADTDHRPGRVLRADRGVCTVLTESGVDRASLAGTVLRDAAADPVRLPCAGDWVIVRHWPDDRTTLEAVLPRRTVIVRRTSDKDSTGQVLAANIDVAAVVEPMDSGPDLGRIERFLALGWESGAVPIIVLTKADVSTDPEAVAESVRAIAPGVEVIIVSADQGVGLDALRPLIAHGRTLGLLGRSGAGKSTLVNALAGATVMGTQQVRRVDGKGRHTTTYRALIPIPGGGAVLDTPGVRGVGLLDGSDGLDRAFEDVVDLIDMCRFSDCAHEGEPGCAVRAALADGDLTPRRWDSWQRLQKEVAFEARRRDVRVRAEEKERAKRLTQHARGNSRP